MNNFLGEIQIFGFNYAPLSWAFCGGQLMAIQQNSALFSLLGTTYGGDGKSTFGLPDMKAQAACGQGAGPGLTPYVIGEAFGSPTVTLNPSEIPSHTHVTNLGAQTNAANRFAAPSAANNYLVAPNNSTPFAQSQVTNGTFAPNVVGPNVGGGLAHPNQQPYLALNFCIALQGQFPQRP
jgi:microcystin-dependent protein